MSATKTITTFETNKAADYSLIINTTNARVKVVGIEGYCNGTANTIYFLQFFASATVPANASIPLYQLMIRGGNGFSFNENDFGLDVGNMGTGPFTTGNAAINFLPNTGNLTIVLSTTADVLTIGTGAVTVSLQVTIEEFANTDYYAGASVGTGNATDNVQVWSDATGPKRLLKLKAINNDAVQYYLMLFATDSPTTGDTPITTWPLNASATIRQNFGTGFVPFSQTAAGVAHDACTLIVSTTLGTLTTVGGASVDFTAWYKTS